MSSLATSLHPAAQAAAGAIAGVVSQALLYPLENVRYRMQVQAARKEAPSNRKPVLIQPKPLRVVPSFEGIPENDESQHRITAGDGSAIGECIPAKPRENSQTEAERSGQETSLDPRLALQLPPSINTDAETKRPSQTVNGYSESVAAAVRATAAATADAATARPLLETTAGAKSAAASTLRAAVATHSSSSSSSSSLSACLPSSSPVSTAAAAQSSAAASSSSPSTTAGWLLLRVIRSIQRVLGDEATGEVELQPQERSDSAPSPVPVSVTQCANDSLPPPQPQASPEPISPTAAATCAVAAVAQSPLRAPYPGNGSSTYLPAALPRVPSTPGAFLRSPSMYIKPEKPDEYRYKDSLDCCAHVLETEGIPGLYRGLNAAVLGTFVSNTVYFYLYTLLKRFILARTGRSQLLPVHNAIVGAAAGFLNVLITTPLWVVNTRLAVERAKDGQHTGVWECFKQIFKKEGLINGFYNGLFPALFLVTNPIVQFVVYERLSALLAARRGGGKLPSWQFFLLGAFGKAIASLLTYPYQVCKSRMQGPDARTYCTTWQTIYRIVKDEGFASFYRGMGFKLTHTVANAALMFVSYEKLADWCANLSLPLAGVSKLLARPLQAVMQRN